MLMVSVALTDTEGFLLSFCHVYVSSCGIDRRDRTEPCLDRNQMDVVVYGLCSDRD